MRFVGPALAATLLAVAMATPAPARAQDALDRADPEAGRRNPAPDQAPAPRPRVTIDVDAPAAPAAGPGAPVMVGAIALRGLHALAPAEFADIVERHIGRTLTPAELAALAGAIAERARARGYLFASAWIEPQRLNAGILAVRVDEGRIDEIRFEGGETPAARRALAPLIDGKPARIDEVERRLLIAGDLANVRVRSSRFVREKGRGVLLVRIGRDDLSARVALTNDGTGALGPERLRIDVDMSAVFFSDDAFSVTYNSTPAEPRELQYWRARYAKRVGYSGTEIALTGSISVARPGDSIAWLDIDSRNWYAGLSLLQPLHRRRRASLWLEAELGLRNLTQRRGGVLARHDRIAAARLTLYGNAQLGGGRLRANATLSQGLAILGATEGGDPLASRRDADGTFTMIDLWTDWTRPLGEDFSLRLAMQGQLAFDPLLLTEEIGLGGTGFLRGYDWAERTGDQGAMAMAELRYDWNRPFGAIRAAQLYAFLDGGYADELGAGRGGSSLASAGGGIRADVTRSLGANLEVAVPLTGPRYESGDEDPRWRFRFIKAF